MGREDIKHAEVRISLVVRNSTMTRTLFRGKGRGVVRVRINFRVSEGYGKSYSSGEG